MMQKNISITLCIIYVCHVLFYQYIRANNDISIDTQDIISTIDTPLEHIDTIDIINNENIENIEQPDNQDIIIDNISPTENIDETIDTLTAGDIIETGTGISVIDNTGYNNIDTINIIDLPEQSIVQNIEHNTADIKFYEMYIDGANSRFEIKNLSHSAFDGTLVLSGKNQNIVMPSYINGGELAIIGGVQTVATNTQLCTMIYNQNILLQSGGETRELYIRIDDQLTQVDTIKTSTQTRRTSKIYDTQVQGRVDHPTSAISNTLRHNTMSPCIDHIQPDNQRLIQPKNNSNILRITEVYFDGSYEWIEITNISDRGFSGMITIGGVAKGSISQFIDIGANEVLILGHPGVNHILSRGLAIDLGFYQQINDTSRLALSLFSGNIMDLGSLLDIFGAEETSIKQLDNKSTSLQRVGDNIHQRNASTYSTKMENKHNTTGQVIANPGKVYYTDGTTMYPGSTSILQSIGPCTSDITISEIRSTSGDRFIEIYGNNTLTGTISITIDGNSFFTGEVDIQSGGYILLSNLQIKAVNNIYIDTTLQTGIIRIMHNQTLMDQVQYYYTIDGLANISDNIICNRSLQKYRQASPLIDNIWTANTQISSEISCPIQQTSTWDNTTIYNTGSNICNNGTTATNTNIDTNINIATTGSIPIQNIESFDPFWIQIDSIDVFGLSGEQSITIYQNTGSILSLDKYRIRLNENKTRRTLQGFTTQGSGSLTTFYKNFGFSKTKDIDIHLIYLSGNQEIHIQTREYKTGGGIDTLDIESTQKKSTEQIEEIDRIQNTFDPYWIHIVAVDITSVSGQQILTLGQSDGGPINLKDFRIRINENKTRKTLYGHTTTGSGGLTTMYKNFGFPKTKNTTIHLLYLSGGQQYLIDSFSYIINKRTTSGSNLSEEDIDTENQIYQSFDPFSIYIDNIVTQPISGLQSITIYQKTGEAINLKNFRIRINDNKTRKTLQGFTTEGAGISTTFYKNFGFPKTKDIDIHLLFLSGKQEIHIQTLKHSIQQNIANNTTGVDNKNNNNNTLGLYTGDGFLSGSNSPLFISTIMANPSGSDTKKETITLQYIGTYPFIDLQYFKIQINKGSKKSIAGTISQGETKTLTGSWTLPNKGGCVHLRFDQTVIDTFCYGESKDDVVRNREGRIPNIQSYTINDLIDIVGLYTSNTQSCITISKKQFMCRKIPTHTPRSRIQQAYIRILETYMKENLYTIWKNSSLIRYNILFTKLIHMNEKGITHYQNIALEDISGHYNTMYRGSASHIISRNILSILLGDIYDSNIYDISKVGLQEQEK